MANMNSLLMERNAVLKSMKVATGGSCSSLKPSVILRKTWICWVQLQPGREPAWFRRRIGSNRGLILFSRILLYTLAAIDIKVILLYSSSSVKDRTSFSLARWGLWSTAKAQYSWSTPLGIKHECRLSSPLPHPSELLVRYRYPVMQFSSFLGPWWPISFPQA